MSNEERASPTSMRPRTPGFPRPVTDAICDGELPRLLERRIDELPRLLERRMDELLEKLAHCPDRPDLIICDYRLRAHENGIHVIERLRSEYNDDEIPGMLITGDTAPDRLREAQESGLLLLHKPVNNSRLRTAINHLVMAHQARLAEPSPPVSG